VVRRLDHAGVGLLVLHRHQAVAGRVEGQDGDLDLPVEDRVLTTISSASTVRRRAFMSDPPWMRFVSLLTPASIVCLAGGHAQEQLATQLPTQVDGSLDNPGPTPARPAMMALIAVQRGPSEAGFGHREQGHEPYPRPS
jgi:hypothetical protein